MCPSRRKATRRCCATSRAANKPRQRHELWSRYPRAEAILESQKHPQQRIDGTERPIVCCKGEGAGGEIELHGRCEDGGRGNVELYPRTTHRKAGGSIVAD